MKRANSEVLPNMVISLDDTQVKYNIEIQEFLVLTGSSQSGVQRKTSPIQDQLVLLYKIVMSFVCGSCGTGSIIRTKCGLIFARRVLVLMHSRGILCESVTLPTRKLSMTIHLQEILYFTIMIIVSRHKKSPHYSHKASDLSKHLGFWEGPCLSLLLW